MTVPILLFAAGLGTRMGALTADRPKPLIQAAGQPLIDHALALTDLPDIGPRVVNVHAKAQMIRDHLAGTDALISDETDLLLETGGGLRKAMPLLGGSPVITMNTDAVWRGPNPISMLVAHWRDDMEALLLVVPQTRVRGHPGKGDFQVGPDGRLERAPGDIYSGVQMIRTDALVAVPDEKFSMNVIWDQIAARGRLYGVRYTGEWCDVGQPSSIPLAEAMLDV
ncbi:nucleotidyltransferase family protein [Yoonia sp. 2307UL14-13]|uniref:nucleotidyltransferase family protein n=1 Tax=Yoonia sp. 2307UL14-13 TaxID=3126506 RepID=UPI0030AAF88F